MLTVAFSRIRQPAKTPASQLRMRVSKAGDLACVRPTYNFQMRHWRSAKNRTMTTAIGTITRAQRGMRYTGRTRLSWFVKSRKNMEDLRAGSPWVAFAIDRPRKLAQHLINMSHSPHRAPWQIRSPFLLLLRTCGSTKGAWLAAELGSSFIL